jgi:hypothetical protein
LNHPDPQKQMVSVQNMVNPKLSLAVDLRSSNACHTGSTFQNVYLTALLDIAENVAYKTTSTKI